MSRALAAITLYHQFIRILLLQPREFGFESGDNRGIGQVIVDVMQSVWVALQIIEFPIRLNGWVYLGRALHVERLGVEAAFDLRFYGCKLSFY